MKTAETTLLSYHESLYGAAAALADAIETAGRAGNAAQIADALPLLENLGDALTLAALEDKCPAHLAEKVNRMCVRGARLLKYAKTL